MTQINVKQMTYPLQFVISFHCFSSVWSSYRFIFTEKSQKNDRKKVTRSEQRGKITDEMTARLKEKWNTEVLYQNKLSQNKNTKYLTRSVSHT